MKVRCSFPFAWILLPLCGTGMTKTVIAEGYFHKPFDPLSVSITRYSPENERFMSKLKNSTVAHKVHTD